MRITDLGEGVCLFEREDGGDRADDHHEDGEQEHGVQHPVLAGDARHPPVANLRFCDSEMGIWSVCEQVMGINLDGSDLDCLGLDFWYLVCLHLHSFWVI